MRDIANLKEISERFNNGTETIEDIINYCRNYEITFGYNATMKVVEKKYFDKLVKKIQELEEENKEIEELDEMQIINARPEINAKKINKLVRAVNKINKQLEEQKTEDIETVERELNKMF